MFRLQADRRNRSLWETWLPFFDALADGEAAFDTAELQVTAGDRVAFATALLRYGSTEELADDNTPRLRLTIGTSESRWRLENRPRASFLPG
jgi:ketosteroid isomerase-like protein